MSDIERFKLKEKVKLSYLRNWGDVMKMHEELGLPVDLIRKEVRKIKGRENRDVTVQISNTLMQYMFSRSNYREHQLQELFDQLRQRSIVVASNCHTVPFRTDQIQNTDGSTVNVYVCLRCNQPCFPIETTRAEMVDKLITIVQELREEDKTLVSFAEKMGYTKVATDNAAVRIEDKRQYLIVGGSKVPADTPQEVRQALSEAAALSPMDREIIRKRLEKTLYDQEKQGGADQVELRPDEKKQ